MRHWNARDCPAMPWKNGGGVTTELAVAPAGATLDDFEWRISSALVACPGAFSQFNGIDRSLAVLQGAALSLQVDELESFDLTPASEVFCFRGEQRIHAAVDRGAVKDFNVMTRRGSYSHRLLRLAGKTEYVVEREGVLVLVYCAQGNADIQVAGTLLRLTQGDMLALEQQDEIGGLRLKCGVQDIFYAVHLAANRE